jgi:ubiquinone/menaquinone biosynthesis C-methylase UbiE
MQTNSAQVFSDNWIIYQKIIDNNYMHHAELGELTNKIFSGFHKPLHVLDIGCGDAETLLPILKKVNIEHYTGYDLSEHVLELANSNLDKEKVTHTLKQGDMLELILNEGKQFDIIHSCFAIHHLQDAEKRKLLQACSEKLLPGGTMIYTDTFRRDLVDRETYIQNYFSFINKDWKLLSEGEKQPIFDHIRQYDFPSTSHETIIWLESFGFDINSSYEPDAFHLLFELRKK